MVGCVSGHQFALFDTCMGFGVPNEVLPAGALLRMAQGRGRRDRRQTKPWRRCWGRCGPESKFCGIHTHPQTYGTVEEVPTAKEEQTQNVEGALAVVPREEAPVFQLQQTNLDIGMFLLRLPIQEIAKVFAFWQSQQGPPLKICPERPSLYQLFSHPLALFFESRKVPVLKNGSRRCVVLFMQQV